MDIAVNKTLTLDETQKLCVINNLPFVSYQLPGTKAIKTFIQKDRKIKKINSFVKINKQEGFIFAPFKITENNSCFIISPDIVIDNDDVISRDLPFKIKKKSNPDLPGNSNIYFSSKKEFEKQVETTIKAIKQKELEKAVISRIIQVSINNDFEFFRIFRKLCNKYKSAFVYIIYIPFVGMWIGASPEMLIEKNDENINVVALAGTQKIDGRELNAVKWDNKNIAEQKIVSDYIYKCLMNNKLQNIKYEKPITSIAGDLYHIKTKFSAQVNEQFEFGNIIDELHPTPAVCGSPKQKAYDFIELTEKHKREYYCGFSGPLNINDSTNLFVNLRCMQVFKNCLALYAGAGITKDSDPEKEWHETEDKTRTLLDVINDVV